MEKGIGGGGNGSIAPTGCYKCGRPGHWSRDCPVNPSSDSNNNLNSNPKENNFNHKTSTSYPFKKKVVATATEKPKKLPRSRPKLTPELLLSNDGLGHILRHFPRAFKCHGRGHEVEQVGTTKRVKKCIQELREKIANGVDPAKLHEAQDQQDISVNEQDAQDTEEQTPAVENTSLQNPDKENIEENIRDEVWEKAMEVEDAPQPSHDLSSGADGNSGGNEPLSKPPGTSTAVVISEEQKARMEANRLKALERAAARNQSSRQS